MSEEERAGKVIQLGDIDDRLRVYTSQRFAPPPELVNEWQAYYPPQAVPIIKNALDLLIAYINAPKIGIDCLEEDFLRVRAEIEEKIKAQAGSRAALMLEAVQRSQFSISTMSYVVSAADAIATILEENGRTKDSAVFRDLYNYYQRMINPSAKDGEPAAGYRNLPIDRKKVFVDELEEVARIAIRAVVSNDTLPLEQFIAERRKEDFQILEIGLLAEFLQLIARLSQEASLDLIKSALREALDKSFKFLSSANLADSRSPEEIYKKEIREGLRKLVGGMIAKSEARFQYKDEEAILADFNRLSNLNLRNEQVVSIERDAFNIFVCISRDVATQLGISSIRRGIHFPYTIFSLMIIDDQDKNDPNMSRLIQIHEGIHSLFDVLPMGVGDSFKNQKERLVKNLARVFSEDLPEPIRKAAAGILDRMPGNFVNLQHEELAAAIATELFSDIEALEQTARSPARLAALAGKGDGFYDETTRRLYTAGIRIKETIEELDKLAQEEPNDKKKQYYINIIKKIREIWSRVVEGFIFAYDFVKGLKLEMQKQAKYQLLAGSIVLPPIEYHKIESYLTQVYQLPEEELLGTDGEEDETVEGDEEDED